MTKVTILPVTTTQGLLGYRAVAGEKYSLGRSAGEALDRLTQQLPESEAGTMVILQHFRPDAFFEASQQQRLAELMEAWRVARDQQQGLPPEQQAELERLIEDELLASSARAQAMVGEMAQ